MRLITICICLLAALPAFASDGILIEVPTRPNVTVPVYLLTQDNAPATLALLPGGDGGLGLEDEEPTASDFLVREREEFLRQGFNVALIGRPSDRTQLDLPTRRGSDHLVDLHRVIDRLKDEVGLPVWLVGMSRGTVSATAAAAAYGKEELAGIVLVSSITSTRLPYSVPNQRLDRIRVPVLVLHHVKDACRITSPDGIPRIMTGLSNAPVAKAVLVDGGFGAWGDTCTSSHWHGYSGMQDKVVDLIAQWVHHPAP